MSGPEDDLLAGIDDGGDASPLAAAVAEASDWIGEGVEAVGEGRTEDGRPCLVVFVSSLDQATRDRVPNTMHGHPVVLSATDTIRTES